MARLIHLRSFFFAMVTSAVALISTFPASASTVTDIVAFSATDFVGATYGCSSCTTSVPTDPVIGAFAVTFNPTLNYDNDTTDIKLFGLNIALSYPLYFRYVASNGLMELVALAVGRGVLPLGPMLLSLQFPILRPVQV